MHCDMLKLICSSLGHHSVLIKSGDNLAHVTFPVVCAAAAAVLCFAVCFLHPVHKYFVRMQLV